MSEAEGATVVDGKTVVDDGDIIHTDDMSRQLMKEIECAHSTETMEIVFDCMRLATNEALLQRYLERYTGGGHMRCAPGVADIVFSGHILEIKTWHEWKSVIGQLLTYSIELPPNTKKIAVFFGPLPQISTIEMIFTYLRALDIIPLCQPIGHVLHRFRIGLPNKVKCHAAPPTTTPSALEYADDFLIRRTTVEATARIKCSELYCAYELYAIEKKILPMSSHKLGARLTGLGFKSSVSNSVRYYKGLRLRLPSDPIPAAEASEGDAQPEPSQGAAFDTCK